VSQLLEQRRQQQVQNRPAAENTPEAVVRMLAAEVAPRDLLKAAVL
jgi:hypothetical protein